MRRFIESQYPEVEVRLVGTYIVLSRWLTCHPDIDPNFKGPCAPPTPTRGVNKSHLFHHTTPTQTPQPTQPTATPQQGQ